MAFNKKCHYCNHPLSYKYLLKQVAVLECPDCKTALHATFLSKLIFSLVFIIPFVLLLMGITDDVGKIIAAIGWITISFLLIQPIILSYRQ